MEFTTLGALVGLIIAIILIIKKVHPAYSLILGALIGGIVGGGGLTGTVGTMVSGAQSMMSSVLRILTSGILAGALIKTGAAKKIADVIVKKLGQRFALVSVATMIICAVGVFVDISVITVAPIAMAIAEKAGYNKPAVLLAMIGGGKAGNIISPNPNTIATAEAFQIDLTALMIRNIVPALAALVVTILLSTLLSKKSGVMVTDADLEQVTDKNLPSFLAAIAGPVVVILLLALRPIVGISIDPLIALPIGGIVCMLCSGQIRNIISYTEFGLSKVVGVSILLVGTGTLAGIIKASTIQYDMIALLEAGNLPSFLLAPIAGILMAAATASTTAGATIASQTFSGTLVASGVSAIDAGAMIHAGATVVDSLPHGSFFHATGGSVNMQIKERMKLIPYEALIGLTSTVVSSIIYLL
jgi:GntP family gluconate:H+ symporter